MFDFFADFSFYVELIAIAWLVSFLLSILTSSLGCFVLWRRMAFFGDTLAHSSMLGFSLALVLQIDFYLGLIFTVLFITVVLYWIEKRSRVLHMDSILAITAYTCLSLGYIVVTILARHVRVDVLDYLFGDILAASYTDVIVLGAMAIIISAILYFNWRNLLAVLINEEMAFVEGINVSYYKAMLVFLLALVVAVAINILGALLITSLLIIPASTARRFARTPGQMIGYSFIISNIAFALGIFLSAFYDFPTSPAIVVILGFLFFFSLAFKRVDG